jgi:transcriptional regulator with XRE-family HTH domain
MAEIKDPQLIKKIATVIKDLREERGLSQEAVYNDTNIHIGRIELASTNMSISTLAALCKYFKIKLSDFFRLVENSK